MGCIAGQGQLMWLRTTSRSTPNITESMSPAPLPHAKPGNATVKFLHSHPNLITLKTSIPRCLRAAMEGCPQRGLSAVSLGLQEQERRMSLRASLWRLAEVKVQICSQVTCLWSHRASVGRPENRITFSKPKASILSTILLGSTQHFRTLSKQPQSFGFFYLVSHIDNIVCGRSLIGCWDFPPPPFLLH